MALVAGNVKLLEGLKKPLGAVADKAKGNLAEALGRVQLRSRVSQEVSGRPIGGYAEEEIGRANDMAGRGVDDALYGILGSGSFDDYRAEQDFQRQKALAERIGDMMSPSTFSQVVGGLSGVAKTGLQAKGLYDALGSVRAPRSTPSYASPLNYEPLDYSAWWGD
jgi:hypothetical protein